MELKTCHRRPLRPDEIGPRVMELSKYLRKNFNAAVACFPASRIYCCC